MAKYLDKVDLNLFLAFDRIYSERSLTRAAESLHVTQPAMSNTLKRLRETFGDDLFVRTPEGMLPTPVAETVIPRVRQALQLLGSSLDGTDKFYPETADRTFRIGMGDLVEGLLLPPLLKQLQTCAPRIQIRSFGLSAPEASLELASHRADLAISVPMRNDPQLVVEPLLEDRYVCAFHRSHPLAGKSLDLERYLGLTHLHMSSRRRGSGHVDMALRALGKRRHISTRVQNYYAAPLILAQANLAASIPERIADSLGLVKSPLPFEVSRLQFHLYWHRSADNDAANKWLRQQLLDLAASKPSKL